MSQTARHVIFRGHVQGVGFRYTTRQIASQYAGASGLEEYTACVADHEGTGFQLWQSLPKVGPRVIRILQVPFRAGVLEFVLNADAKNATTGQAALDMILLTFRSNEQGPLETTQRLDKS